MTIVNLKGEWVIIKESSDDIKIEPLDKDRAYEVKGTANVRTVKQNASIHLYCKKVSEALNAGGFSLQKVVSLFKKSEIEWTMLSVKDILWRNIQIALTNKLSTTKLESDEVTNVYKNIDNYLSQKVGIESIDFPSEQSLIWEQNYKKDK